MRQGVEERGEGSVLVIENDGAGENVMKAVAGGTELSFRRFGTLRFGAVGDVWIRRLFAISRTSRTLT
jgi:hypothetical protein